jgi:hypothetical protein
MIDFEKNTVSLDLLKRVLKEIKNTDRSIDIIDSFSDNQFKSKKRLLELINQHTEIDQNSVVAIFGCWYGSILIPSLSQKVKKIYPIDLDDMAIRIGKNRFFHDLKNVHWSTGDVFTQWRDDYSTTTLFINTSCEHMLPMKEWPWWNNLQNDAYFAFQSNNMDQIEGHINCVPSLEEFKNQLPLNSKVIFEDELEDDRGTRYTVIGKISIAQSVNLN